MIDIIGASPEAFSDAERVRFQELVEQAGEVTSAALLTNISTARALVLLKQDGIIRGVTALKRPQAGYRQRIEKRSSFALPPETYPYELGYVFIEPAMQGRGLSHQLVAKALSHDDGKAIFATVRADNEPMRTVLNSASFIEAGQPYLGRDKRVIRLFVRNTTDLPRIVTH